MDFVVVVFLIVVVVASWDFIGVFHLKNYFLFLFVFAQFVFLLWLFFSLLLFCITILWAKSIHCTCILFPIWFINRFVFTTHVYALSMYKLLIHVYFLRCHSVLFWRRKEGKWMKKKALVNFSVCFNVFRLECHLFLSEITDQPNTEKKKLKRVL